MISGTFTTIFNDENDNQITYTVMIDANLNATIHDTTELVNYQSGDPIIMFGPKPVILECDRQDLQKRIIISQATINLVSDKNLTSYLFADTSRSIPVAVLKDTTYAFHGFVDPLQFNQKYAHKWESIKITATDPLGALEDLTVGDLENVDATTTITSLELIKKILKAVGLTDATIDVSSINQTVLNSITNTVINMSPFFGESEDDWMTLYDTLTEICKYFNLYVSYYNTKAYVTCTINATPTEVSIGNFSSVAMDASTSISVDDVYSQVNLTCEIEPVDDTLLSLVDDDSLYSDYNKEQVYMKEVNSPNDNTPEWFWALLKRNAIIEDPKPYILNNFCYVKRNDAWTFGPQSYIAQMGGREPNPSGPQGAQTYLPMTGDQRNVLTWLKTSNKINGAFISFGKGNKLSNLALSETEDESNPTMADCFIVSINGNTANTQADLDNMATKINNSKPICSYKSIQNYNLVPIDANTINYLIIQGKITLNPLQELTGPQWDTYAQKINNKISDLSWPDYPHITGPQPNFWKHTVPDPDASEGYAYYQQVWMPNQSTYGVHGALKNDKNKKMQFSKSQYQSDVNTYVDIDKVPVLACELKVGDKYCVERLDQGAQGVGKFEWKTDIECSQLGLEKVFTIGMSLKRNDYLVGEAHDIQDNTSYKDNIDESGTAIPIKLSDGLNGTVEFNILGPYNLVYDEGDGYVLSFRDYRSAITSHTRLSVLQNIQSIIIDSFQIKMTSNNGGISRKKTNADNDLVYASDMNPAYIEKLEEDLKICTPLTSEECTDLGIKIQISNSYIYDVNNEPFRGFQSGNNYIKPEECLVDYYYKEYNTPAKMISTCINSSAFTNGLKGTQLTEDMTKKFITGIYTGDAGAYRIMNYKQDLKYMTTNIELRQYITYNNTQI